MNGTAALLVVSALFVAGAVGPVAGATPFEAPDRAAQVGTPENVTSNASAEPAAPGALLSGVVGVQRAEIDGELAGRSFGLQIAKANSNSSKASVVADQLVDLNQRTAELSERKQQLVEARQNGTISQARFRAEMASLAAETGVVEHQLDRTETTARDIPGDLLESKGVNATAIQTIRNQTKNVASPDVADIARSVAGPNVGRGLAGNASAGPPTDVPGNAGSELAGGPPSDAPGQSGNASESSPDRTPHGSGPADPGESNRPEVATGASGSTPDRPGGERGNSSQPDRAIDLPLGVVP